MVVCCYAEIKTEWTERKLNNRLLELPPNLRDEALHKRQWADRQLTITGKLLLKEILPQLGVNRLQLSDLIYNSHKRPYFDVDLDFNIAHSGNLVICCATNKGKIGVDIEQVKPISFDEYTDYFTTHEWDIIHDSPDQLEGFYDLWTRKEAVLKAIGTGFHIPLDTIDVSGDIIMHNELGYYIKNLNIRKSYKCHVATTEKAKISEPIEFTY